MKLSAIALLLSCIGSSLVAAAPATAHVVVVTNHREFDPSLIRIGLAGAPPTAHSLPAPGRKTGCMKKMRNKAVELSNKFRVILGLPKMEENNVTSIASLPRVRLMHHHQAFAPTTGTTDMDKVHPHHRHHGHRHHRFHGFGLKRLQNSPFMTRLTVALMALGKWEGRAVAFVLGCGLGVLIRIAWVLAVLLYRSAFARPTEEYEVTEYIVFEGEEALPEYQTAEEEKAELSKPTA